MAKPYAQLRAQMSEEAQRQAEEKGRRMLALLSPEVRCFLAAHPAIAPVLDEMAAPLQTCFGQHTAVLEVLTDGEEGDFLSLTVYLPHTNTRDAAAALARFDQTWWGEHCHRTDGLLVVDYQADSILC